MKRTTNIKRFWGLTILFSVIGVVAISLLITGFSLGWFESKIRTIKFVNYDDSVILTLNLKDGEMPKYLGDEPNKPEDDEYTYKFNGFGEIEKVTGDKTYKAQYKKLTKITLKNVEFKNITSLKTLSFEHTKPDDYIKSSILTNSYANDDIEVYYNGGTEDEPENVCLVYEGKIIANSNNYFAECNKLTTLSLNNFDTSKMTNMNGMFKSCRNLSRIIGIEKMDTKNVTNMSYMFSNCGDLTENFYALDLSNFNTSLVEDMSYMFSRYGAKTLDLSSFDTRNVTDMSGMFNCANLETLDFTNCPNFKPSSVKSMNYMFNYCEYLTKIVFSDSFETSNVTDMANMFSSCSNLTEVVFSDSFNTSEVTNMANMFYYCKKLQSIDISKFDTNKVIDASKMFYYCTELTSIKFSQSKSFANTKRFNEMFRSCGKLTELNLSSFSTENATQMNEMFRGCIGLIKLDLTSFNTENIIDVNNFAYLFSECSSLKEINLSSFVMKNSSSSNIWLDYTFKECSNLEKIYMPKLIDEGVKIQLPKMMYKEGEEFIPANSFNKMTSECQGLILVIKSE